MLVIIVSFIAFYYYPIFSLVKTSFYAWQFSGGKFVGFRNYWNILTNSYNYRVVINTAYYVVGVTSGSVILGLIFALIFDGATCTKLSRIWQTMFFIPIVISLAAVSMVWRWLFEPEIGLINYALSLLGFSKQAWLRSTVQAMPAIIIVGIWQNIGFSMIILLSGLKAIPKEMKESAMIDGASSLKMIWHIILPLIKPVFLVATSMSVIFAFRTFTLVFVMTKGGPAGSTRTIAYEIYKQGFGFLKMGYASALGVLLFIAVAVITLLQIRMISKSS